METSKGKATKHTKHTKHQSNSLHFRSEVWMPSCILRIGVHNCFPAKECKNRIQRLISNLISEIFAQIANALCKVGGDWTKDEATAMLLCGLLSRFLMREDNKSTHDMFLIRVHMPSHAGLSTPLKGRSGTQNRKIEKKSENSKNSAFQLKQLSIDRRGVDFSRFGYPENGIADEERPRLRGDRWHCVWKGGWFYLKGCHL